MPMTACRLTRCSVCAMALRCALGAQQGRERRAERVLCSSSLCRPRPAAEPQAASCVHAGVLQRIVWYAFQQTGKSDGSLWLGIWVMMMRVARGIQEHKQKEERRRWGGGGTMRRHTSLRERRAMCNGWSAEGMPKLWGRRDGREGSERSGRETSACFVFFFCKRTPPRRFTLVG